MPRLKLQDYLALHDWLAELWENYQSVFGLVSPREQWYLHDYFVPSWTSLTEAELLAYRQKIAGERPTLPQCAGRAVRKLNQALITAKETKLVKLKPGDKKQPSVVSAVVHPQIDVDRLTRALLRAAEDIKLDPPA
jgi:hypothetical protein